MAYQTLAERYREIEDDIKRNTNFPPPPAQQQSPDLPSDETESQRPFSRLAEDISTSNPQTTNYSISMRYKNFYTGGTILTGRLATGTHSGTDVYDSDKIKIRKVDLNNLGTAGQLGSGDFVLESLYRKTHKNNPNREPIDTGRVDENGNPILINTTRAGMGNLGGLDIKGYSTNEIFYRGADRGDEPYQIPPIGSEDAYPTNHTSRLLTYYNSSAGKELVLRENFIQYIHSNPPKFNFKKARKLTFARALTGLGRLAGDIGVGLLAARFQPGHNALLSNLVLNNALLDYKDRTLFEIGSEKIGINQALGALGTSIGDIFGGVRNRFSVGYSAQRRTLRPFGNLGDKPWNLDLLRHIKKVNIKKDKKGRELGKIRKALRKTQNKIHSVGVKESERIGAQTVRKVTPFMDLTGPGNHDEFYEVGPVQVRAHGYDDKISNSGVEEPIKTTAPLETTKAIEVGDFYVRFKDLRDNAFIYFRGYIKGITENVSPSWNPIDYVGRSEPVYVYQKAERDISFNIDVYPQNFKEEEFMYKKLDRLTSMAYPEYESDTKSLTRMKPPFTEMFMAHIGSKEVGQFGYIKSLSYTVNESGDWNALELLPRVFTIAISYQIVNRQPADIDTKFYRPSLASPDMGLNFVED